MAMQYPIGDATGGTPSPIPARKELPEFLRTSSPPIPPPRVAPLDPVAEQRKTVEFYGAIQQLSSSGIVTLSIIAINVLVYLAMAFSGAGFFEISSDKALRWGADLWALTTGGQWWRLLTSTFLHFGLIHIGFNMWALYQAGRLTERLYGRWFYLLIYLYGAVMSGLASIWWDRPAVCAGASGAIFAVFGALLAYLILHRQTFPRAVVQPLTNSTAAFIAYNIFFGLTQKNISNSAHIGGLISGLLIGMVVARPMEASRRRRQLWPRLIGGLLVSAATAGAAIQAIPKSAPTSLAAITDEDPAAVFNQGVGFLTASPPNYARAIDCFRRSAAAGMPEAMYNLGVMYGDGHGVRRDYPQAMQWFRKAADLNYPLAMLQLGRMYLAGEGTPVDRAAAIAWLRKAADAGQSDAMYDLGICYYDADGVPRDFKQGASWFSKAAAAGSVPAMGKLAVLYSRGRITAKDFDAHHAMAWFSKASQAGDSAATCAVGQLYENGDGVARDYAKAMTWYRKAAKAGSPDAYTHLGMLYAKGRGVPMDPVMAAQCYQQAAAAGDPQAMRLLADCFSYGVGVKIDPAKAAELYKAADAADR